jgi:adenosylcobalamin-dependent ribonucleoside-triphosphate reductase
MGTPIVEKIGSAALQNCGFVSTRDIDKRFSEPFCFTMDMSMLGVGMGFDTLGATQVEIREPRQNGNTLVIDDSREGWIECLRSLLESYIGGPNYNYDFSKIRRAGAPIKTFGGIAPGPEPLRIMVESIRSLLGSRIGDMLTSVDIVDLMCYIGRCVVSGNIRRSALIALGESDDRDFIAAKDREKFASEVQSHRWASNNSIIAHKGQRYSDIVAKIRGNGEPGVIFLDNIRSFGRYRDGPDSRDDGAAGVNPCGEQPLEPFELCNLVETFPANHESIDEYIDTLKYAFMFGKSVSLIPTHDPRANAVIGRNRRIGISMSGIDQAITKFGRRQFLDEFCDRGYLTIRHWDRIYSRWLCVPESIRVTTVKPSGTVSLLAGSFPGIHKTHAKRYLRLVRFGVNSPHLKAFEKAGYLVEDDYYDEFSKVVYFPVVEKNFKRSKAETSMREMVQNVADMQHYWSDNAVSCTITFSPGEEDEIEDILETYEDRLKTLTIMPVSEHGYIQAPYMDVIEEGTLADQKLNAHKIRWTAKEFEDYVAKLDSTVLRAEFKRVSEEGIGEKYCNNDSCEIKGEDNEAIGGRTSDILRPESVDQIDQDVQPNGEPAESQEPTHV